MVVCKCPKATKLHCFVHKIPVCGECICFPEHQICTVRTSLEWVIAGEYDWPPKCCHCHAVLKEESDSQTTRLGCLHIIHTNCLVSHVKSFPPHTAPAGYVCPDCSTSIWPPKIVKDSGSHLHSKLKEAIMLTGLEKNLFGNHPVSLPATESRGPPPPLASDPLMHASATGGREPNANLPSSVAKDSEGYSAAAGTGPTNSSFTDIVEIDGPKSASPSLSNHQPSQSQRPSRQNKLNWSREEDEALCNAWMMIGKDPVMGSTYWERIQINFQSQPGGTTARNSSGLMNRFSYLHPLVNKFCGCYKTIQDTPSSRFNAEDLIQTAKELYKKQVGVDFKLDHCWYILRNSAKWHNHCNAQQEKQKPNQQTRKRDVVDLDSNELGNSSESVSTTPGSFQNNPSTPSTPGVSTPASANLGDDDPPAGAQGSHDLPRPLGQKAAKKGKDFKEQDRMVNEVGLEGERWKIQAKIEISLAQERTKQLEIESRERMAKYENERVQMEFERDMMRQDPNKAPTKEAKAWIIAHQKAILNKFNQGGAHM
ncbi:uncharacterized protein LOC132311851 isoform X2 [Cornus florida]|uniref:uncharacterized protein LOC132311851 isoform X2 n=1 Tax=Cornus florida TaxID=4283 RepID=UPI002896D94D|nr:uncharacterized protein LOC132311851 isoform X2 [Cornus florida]